MSDDVKQEKIELRPNTHIITESDLGVVAKLVIDLGEAKHFSFDVETDGKHFILAKLDGIGFYIPDSDRGYYINMYGASSGFIKNMLDTVKPYLEDDKKGKIGHNILYDMHVMKNYDVDVKGPLFDTMIASYISNPDDRPFKLKRLVPRHLKIDMREYEDIDRENITEMAVYCMEDARCTYLLYKDRKKVLLDSNMWRLFNDIEMPFLRVLFDMERRGIQVDLDRLTAMRKRYEKKVEELRDTFCLEMFGKPYIENRDALKSAMSLESDTIKISVTKSIKKIKKRVEVPFNIDSNDHLAELLYSIKKYPVVSRTKTTGKPSVDKLAMDKLSDKGYEPVSILLEYRTAETLLKTFIIPILDEHTINGRVYPSYLQHGTRTGRLSSSKPNFQNIPVRTKDGKEIRRCFMADKNWKLIDGDLSQIELRVMAHFSKDPNLLRAYRTGLDIHNLTGELVLGIKGREMTKAERTLVKNLNFGLTYGAGPRKFATMANLMLPKDAKLTEDSAKAHIERFFSKYVGIRTFQNVYPREVKKTGYATTVLGRRRYMPDIKLPKTNNECWRRVAAAERESVSTIIQGSAADIIKLAMIRAHSRGIKLVAQIHDQLIATAPAEDVDRSAAVLKDCMENCGLKFEVPIVANLSTSERWEGHAEEAALELEE